MSRDSRQLEDVDMDKGAGVVGGGQFDKTTLDQQQQAMNTNLPGGRGTTVGKISGIAKPFQGKQEGDTRKRGGCGKPGCTCDVCTCGPTCKCGDTNQQTQQMGMSNIPEVETIPDLPDTTYNLGVNEGSSLLIFASQGKFLGAHSFDSSLNLCVKELSDIFQLLRGNQQMIGDANLKQKLHHVEHKWRKHGIWGHRLPNGDVPEGQEFIQDLYQKCQDCISGKCDINNLQFGEVSSTSVRDVSGVRGREARADVGDIPDTTYNLGVNEGSSLFIVASGGQFLGASSFDSSLNPCVKELADIFQTLRVKQGAVGDVKLKQHLSNIERKYKKNGIWGQRLSNGDLPEGQEFIQDLYQKCFDCLNGNCDISTLQLGGGGVSASSSSSGGAGMTPDSSECMIQLRGLQNELQALGKGVFNETQVMNYQQRLLNVKQMFSDCFRQEHILNMYNSCQQLIDRFLHGETIKGEKGWTKHEKHQLGFEKEEGGVPSSGSVRQQDFNSGMNVDK